MKKISKFAIGDLLPIGMTFIVLGIAIAYGLKVMGDVKGDMTANSAEANATDNLAANFTKGIDNVSAKIPTVLLVAAVVLILGVLVLLVATWQRMNMGGGMGAQI